MNDKSFEVLSVQYADGIFRYDQDSDGAFLSGNSDDHDNHIKFKVKFAKIDVPVVCGITLFDLYHLIRSDKLTPKDGDMEFDPYIGGYVGAEFQENAMPCFGHNQNEICAMIERWIGEKYYPSPDSALFINSNGDVHAVTLDLKPEDGYV